MANPDCIVNMTMAENNRKNISTPAARLSSRPLIESALLDSVLATHSKASNPSSGLLSLQVSKTSIILLLFYLYGGSSTFE
jgi:hypothetical protein